MHRSNVKVRLKQDEEQERNNATKKNLYLENIAVFRSKEKNLFDKNQLHRLEEKLLEKGIYMTGPVILHNRDVQNTDYELLISVNRTEGS